VGGVIESRFENIKLQITGTEESLVLYFPKYSEQSEWYKLLSSQITDQNRSKCPIVGDSNSSQFRRRSITLTLSTSASSDDNILTDNYYPNSPLRFENRQKILPEHFLEEKENEPEAWFNEFQDLYKLPIADDIKIKFLQFAPKQPEKILILRVLNSLSETGHIDHSLYLKLRTKVVHTKLFDAQMVSSDGPAFWSLLTSTSFSTIDHNNYSDFIKSICAILRLFVFIFKKINDYYDNYYIFI
jgi:hypothetical protein